MTVAPLSAAVPATNIVFRNAADRWRVLKPPVPEALRNPVTAAWADTFWERAQVCIAHNTLRPRDGAYTWEHGTAAPAAVE